LVLFAVDDFWIKGGYFLVKKYDCRDEYRIDLFIDDVLFKKFAYDK